MPSAAETASPPFRRIAGDPACGVLLLADHATNRVPEAYGTLGLDPVQLQRHIGYDIGIEPLTEQLAARLGAPAVLSCFSRLLIDPNRGTDDPTLVMRLSDGAIVPSNARIDAGERAVRIERYWRPYQTAIEAAIDAAFAGGLPPILVSMHSYTPVWRGRPRPWHCGILWDQDPRFAVPLIERLRSDPALVVGDNEPYDGALKGDTMYRHGTARGLAHAIVEVRQDLIADAAGVAEWADRLAPIVAELAARAELHHVIQHGSRTGPVTPEEGFSA